MDAQKDTSPRNLTGQVIGNYKILQRIGTSNVFLAINQQNKRQDVAFKAFYPDPYACNHDMIWERLQQIQTLDHENIVRVYEIGEHEDLIYAVMEYIPGRNLYDLMQLNPRLHWGAAAELARDIVQALVAAHHKGICHRCLHPDRILLGKSGLIKVSFCNEGEITPSKEVACYVSPELFLGKALEEPSDVYSLGAIICNIVTGKPPLAGKEPKEIALKHRDATSVLPSYGVADIPHPLSTILVRSMDADPGQRYCHSYELQAAIHNFLKNDIGPYKLGSYRELFSRVDYSESDREFTQKVREIRRESVSDKAKAAKATAPAPAPVKPVERKPQAPKISQRLSTSLGTSYVHTILWAALSLSANIAFALLFLKLAGIGF